VPAWVSFIPVLNCYFFCRSREPGCCSGAIISFVCQTALETPRRLSALIEILLKHGAHLLIDMMANWVAQNYGMEIAKWGFSTLDYEPRDIGGNRVLPQQHDLSAA
jgi:hypothetical protein